MTKYIYLSNFKQDIIKFLEFKKSMGYDMWISSFYLKKFDEFCVANFQSS